LEEALRRALEEYNRREAPLAKARLVSVEGGTVKVELSGPFYYECGMYAWVDSLVNCLQSKLKCRVKEEVLEEAPGKITIGLLLQE